MRYPAIVGIGHYYPSKVIDNAYFPERLGLTSDWIVMRTGIERRYHASEQEATSDLLVPAAVECLRSAGRNPSDVEGIVVATVTPDHLFPSTAALVQTRIGASRAWAFDLSASSAGFVFALAVARSFIMSGNARSILVCGGDKMSSVVDGSDPTTAILFGDGAGAVLMEEAVEDGVGVVDVVLRSDGAGAPFLRLPAGGSRKPPSANTVAAREHCLVQDGTAIFRSAVSMMSDVCVAVMYRNQLTPENVTWLVPHQANQRIMDAVADHLQIPRARTMSNVARVGNTWGGSIPGCLSEWHQGGRLRPGDRLMLAGFGAGYSAGAAYIKWSLPQPTSVHPSP